MYGDYLTATLDDIDVPAGSMLRRTSGEVVDVQRSAGEWKVVFREGWTAAADRIVLALGNPPPHALPRYADLGEAFVTDPWSGDLEARVAGARRVLLVGTGLTMVDAERAHANPLWSGLSGPDQARFADEVTAIPDLRSQAVALAADVTARAWAVSA